MLLARARAVFAGRETGDVFELSRKVALGGERKVGAYGGQGFVGVR